MSKELPFFKFFPAEWIMGNISHENYSIQGLFITACCHYWHQECNVNETNFSKILGKREIKKLIVAELVKQVGQQICIEFLDEQYSELSELHKVRSENGKKGVEARLKAKHEAKNKQRLSNKDKEEDKEIDKIKKKKEKEVIVYFPNDILLNEKYIAFLNFRKEKKKPVLKTSIDAHKKELMKLSENKSDIAIQILHKSIANGWQGIFEIKTNNNGGKQPTKIGSINIPDDYDPEIY